VTDADRLGAMANLVAGQTLLAVVRGDARLAEAGARLVDVLITEAELALAREESGQ
jgi:hypothetical protein